MARDLNKWQGIGRIGQDLELKFIPSGSAVLNFSLACGDDYKDKQGQKVEKTEWINCVAFGKSAELIDQYCSKGSQLFVEGKFTTRKWQDKESGKDRYSSEINVNNFQFLGGKSDNSGFSAPQAQQGGAQQQSASQTFQQPAQQSSAPNNFDPNDDIPFNQINVKVY